MKKYKLILSKFSKKTIMVVGDVVLDRYIQGSVSRISPEAPVPIVLEEKSFYTPGGAANVAANLKTLGADVLQVGRIGNDFEGKLLKRELKRAKIDISGVFVDVKAPTVTKTRVVAQHQQVVRIDKERVGSPVKDIYQKIVKYIEKNIDNCDAVIVSDYGKGIVSEEFLNFICPLAKSKDKIIVIDPKVENFKNYHSVTCITPNLKETENAIRNIKITSHDGSSLAVNSDQLKTEKAIDLAGAELIKFLDLDSLLITLGEKGMRLFEKGKKPFSIKTKAQDVFDVTGAGDAVISVFTLALTAGAKKREAADLANTAAGIVVSHLGVKAVTKDELQEALQ